MAEHALDPFGKFRITRSLLLKAVEAAGMEEPVEVLGTEAEGNLGDVQSFGRFVLREKHRKAIVVRSEGEIVTKLVEIERPFA